MIFIHMYIYIYRERVIFLRILGEFLVIEQSCEFSV